MVSTQSQFLLDDYEDCSYEILTWNHVEQVGLLLAETFCFSEPLTMGKITYEETLPFSFDLISNAASQGLSVIGTEKSSGKILSYALGNDIHSSKISELTQGEHLSKILEENSFFKRVLYLWDSLVKEYKTKHANIIPGDIYQLFMDGTRQGYEGKGIGAHSRKIARELALQKKFKGMVIQTTNENTRKMSEKLGLKELACIPLSGFCFDKEGTEEHPWSELDQSIVLLGEDFEHS